MSDKAGRYGVVRIPSNIDRAKSAKFHWLVNVATLTHARPVGEFVDYVVHSPLLPIVELGSDLPRYTVIETLHGAKTYTFVKESDRGS